MAWQAIATDSSGVGGYLRLARAIRAVLMREARGPKPVARGRCLNHTDVPGGSWDAKGTVETNRRSVRCCRGHRGSADHGWRPMAEAPDAGGAAPGQRQGESLGAGTANARRQAGFHRRMDYR